MYSSLALDFLMIKITIPPRNKTGFADKKSRLLLTKKQTACGHTTDEKKRMKKKGDFGKQPWFFVGFSWKNHRPFFQVTFSSSPLLCKKNQRLSMVFFQFQQKWNGGVEGEGVGGNMASIC